MKNLEFLRELATSTLSEVIPRGSACALVDFPNHSNVGDSAIWQGEVAYCREVGCDIRYVASIPSYAEPVLRRIMPNGTVLIHGGGNFGSLWKHHQDFRNAILAHLRDYKVVQLPQSLHFGNDGDCFAITADLIRKHPDFTLLVRDKPSQKIGEALGARTILCPDSAVFLAGQLDRHSPAVDFLSLVRTDKESTGMRWPSSPAGYSCETVDWIDEPRHPLDWWSKKLQQRAHGRFGHTRIFQSALRNAFNAIARTRVERGVRLLSRGEVVITDRLHAHLIASLLEIPNVVMDNHYGKIHNYMECWGTEFGEPCTDNEKMWDKAIDLLQKKP